MIAGYETTKLVYQIIEQPEHDRGRGRRHIQSNTPNKFRILDCSTFPPESSETLTFGEGEVHSICCVKILDSPEVQKAFEDVFLITCGRSDICSYILGSETFRWKVRCGTIGGMEREMIAESFTTDGKKHLFVVDSANQCVHVFSLDGIHIGIPVK